MVLYDDTEEEGVKVVNEEKRVEEIIGAKPVIWDGQRTKTADIMTWSNESSRQQEVEGEKEQAVDNIREQLNMVPTTLDDKKTPEMQIVACPSCDQSIQIHDKAGILDLPGLPAGVKFDPSDQEILEHLEAKVLCSVPKLHPLIGEFIPTIEGENGICYTHPEKLPGVNKDGQVRHFFHRPSKAYTTGTRKRRKVHTDEDGSETRWHKTGKTRPVYVGGALKGFKKILVLYTNYGRQRKPEKTNWVMHQYHLGSNEEEKDGELVVSKVFYQTQPRQCGSAIKDSFEKRSMNDGNSGDDFSIPKNTAGLIEYYNPSFINYVDHGVHDRESPPQLIPNLALQGDGSSYIRLSMDPSKARLEGK